jgi:hypothetical protein
VEYDKKSYTKITPWQASVSIASGNRGRHNASNAPGIDLRAQIGLSVCG